MCGRYALYLYLPLVADLFRVQGKVPDFAPRYNIAPSQDIPIVRERAAGVPRELALARWGFVPAWSKEPGRLGAGGPPPPINARSETVEAKPAFREAFKHRRCLVPADGFYEWKAAPAASGERAAKQPYLVTVVEAPFAMAGLWERWSPKTGEAHAPFESCVILTTSPNPLLAELHDRMPVILPRESWDQWLSPGTSASEARELLRPLSEAAMAMRPVSRRINSPKVDDPSCIEPVEEVGEPEEPPSLFDSA